ncbi:MAG: hypothetical protein ACRC3F_02285, partial [Billgrantia desiderata]
AAGAALLVLYALFIDYDMALELSGFVLLAVAVGWDVLLRRRSEAELLGVEKKWRDRSRA